MAGRPARNRSGDYSADAQQLIHLSRAVMVDNAVVYEWRENVRDILLNAATALMNPRYSLARKANGA